MSFKKGDKVIYEGKETEIVAVVPMGVDPKGDNDDSRIDLDFRSYNPEFIGGGVKDHESYLITVPIQRFEKSSSIKPVLYWPRVDKLEKVKEVKISKPKEYIKNSKPALARKG